jgi:hypothetical protein
VVDSARQSQFAISWNWRLYTNAYMHEMGHNQGMHHAGNEGGSGDQYKDGSDFMGYLAFQMKCTNSAHMRYLGWTDSTDRITHDPATKGTKRFRLQSLSSNHRGGKDLSLMSTVIVPARGLSGTANKFLYVAYRAKTQGDSGISGAYAYKVEMIVVGSSDSITRRQPLSLDLNTPENSGQFLISPSLIRCEILLSDFYHTASQLITTCITSDDSHCTFRSACA